MSKKDNKYKSFPFWSWNDKLDKKELIRQIDWMNESGIGGFFMHARGGLITEYLSKEWFDCVEACLKRAKELGMEAYAYDENGWPSGFAGGKLLEDQNNHDRFLTFSIGKFDNKALASYDISKKEIARVYKGSKVLNVYDNVSSSTADICNPKVVKEFINLTHEQYKKHDKYGNLRGFFTDEPQYFRWNTPYTRMMPEYFAKNYKENILDRLGLLFVEKEGYRDFRFKYYKAMHQMMLDSFAKQVYKWCDKNNYKLTGHYIEENSLANQMMCCGGIMPFYEYEHIPGVDFLGRRISQNAIAKQLGSVATQLGKEQRMAEIYACAGWDATPNELKVITESLMCDGVNIICQHLLPYSEHGQRKRDYPEHYSRINPWVDKSFKTFNDYFTKLGKKFAKSKEIVNVGLFQPIRSCYFDYKRYEFSDPKNRFNLGKIDLAYCEAYKALQNKHIPYHILDEDILAKHAYVKDKTLVVGKCKYDCIVFPAETLTMEKSTEKLLHEFVKNGGKVLLLGEKPSYLEGKEFKYSYLKTNTSFDEIIKNQEFRFEETSNVVSSLYEDENGKKYLFVVNIGDATKITINNVSYNLDKYESKTIYLDKIVAPKLSKINSLVLDGNFDVVKGVDNFITLDKLCFSKTGKTYSKLVNHMGVLMKLIKEKYNGDLYLKYLVDIKDVPSKCFALIENTNTKKVFVNGKEVKKVGSILEKDLWKFNISKYLKKGKNEIIVKIDFFEKEIVNYALFDKNVTESIKNCLVYDTTIEPIYLMGNFGVYGDFKQEENCYVANKFFLSKQQKKIKDFINDGFPFFRGNILLRKVVNIEYTNCELVIKNRFQSIGIYINGKFVETLMFKNKLNLSKYLRKGKNEIVLDYVVSNRNLLGPHHLPDLEPLSVGPNSFEVVNSWKEDATSDYVLDRYSFVKVI